MNKSVFIFSCLCGRQFQKEEKESFRCSGCGRLLVLEWLVEAAEIPIEVEQHAYRSGKILHLLGLEQNRACYLHNGRQEKLTDFGGGPIDRVCGQPA